MDREEEAAAHAESALAAYEAAGADHQAGVAATELATILLNYRRMERAVEVLQPRYDADADSAAAAALAAAYARAEMMVTGAEHMERAIDAADAALRAAEASRDNKVLADALITKGTAYQFNGRQVEGTMLLKGALELAEAADLTGQRSRAINNLAVVLSTEDERAALALTKRGLDAGIRSGNGYEMHYWALRRAWFLALDGV